MHLYIIRHGQTTANEANCIDTAYPGASLTPKGQNQARLLADRLEGREIQALYASPLVRTQQTIAPTAQRLHLRVHVLEGLREIDAGSWEGMPGDAGLYGYYHTLGCWLDALHGGNEEDLLIRQGGSVNGQEVLTRFDQAIAHIESHDYSTAALVAHGAVIAFWIGARILGVSTQEALTGHLPNTGIIELEGTLRDGYRIISWEKAGSFLDMRRVREGK